MNGTSWLLGGRYPWRSADPGSERSGGGTAVVAGPGGLSLAAVRRGPYGLEATDGSLGRLTLPRGVAVSGDTVLVLSGDGSNIYRYDPVSRRMIALPRITAAPASNIAAVGGLLYIAHAQARRVQVVDAESLALVRTYRGLGSPTDVAAGPGAAYVLDSGAGRVYRLTPGRDRLELVVERGAPGHAWRRIAVDRDSRVYVLLDGAEAPPVLEVYEPSGSTPATVPAQVMHDAAEARAFFAVPPVTSSRGGLDLSAHLADPQQLRAPRPHVRTWSVGDRVYAIDRDAREVRVLFQDGRVRHRFGPIDADGAPVTTDEGRAWRPVDVADGHGCVLILDEQYQRVYAHDRGSGTLRPRFAARRDQPGRWRRLAVDGGGCVLLWDGIAADVERFDQRGQPLGTVPARQVRSQFGSPDAEPIPAGPFRLTREGTILTGPSLPPPAIEPAYVNSGVWFSTWLDSDIYNCQWHVVEISMEQLPPGSRVIVRTRTSNDAQHDALAFAMLEQARAAGSWRSTEALAGPAQAGEPNVATHADVLVQSGPGQHLQLQVELTGSGLTTPIVGGIRLRFPRESLLEYLPAIYSQPEDQRAFLDRFLSIAQSTWSEIERNAETFERFLDPDSVPPSAIGYLASWLSLGLEGTWSVEQKRALLRAMPRLRAIWGTVDGMTGWLRVYLAAMSGVDEAAIAAQAMPRIVERFVDRRAVMLGDAVSTTLPAPHALWSPSVERRFQLGVFDIAGEIELVSVGDPDLDVFRHYAHAFRVFVPAAWVRTADDEAMLRRAIEQQKPAHATYELVLIEPAFRIGEQSTIGLDTFIGGTVRGALACPHAIETPSRPPHQRLGYDLTVGCGDPGPAGTVERILS